MREVNETSRWRRGWEHVRPLVLMLTVLCTFRSAVADWHDVPTQSMEPTILVGDRITVNKLAYDLKVPFTLQPVATWSTPRPGDIIVFRDPRRDIRMVKRVVGVAGDQIALRDNQLLRNGRPVSIAAAGPTAGLPLTDPPPHVLTVERLGTVDHAVLHQPNRRARRSFGPVTVPAGHIFVMGDNRDNSGDSRSFGFVPHDRIEGKAIGVALSFDDWKPRWSRFASSLD